MDPLAEIRNAVSRAMRDEGDAAAADEILTAKIESCTYDKDAGAGYIYLTQCEPVHDGETSCAETICFASPHWFNVDLRASGKVFGIDFLSPSDSFAVLARLIP